MKNGAEVERGDRVWEKEGYAQKERKAYIVTVALDNFGHEKRHMNNQAPFSYSTKSI